MKNPVYSFLSRIQPLALTLTFLLTLILTTHSSQAQNENPSWWPFGKKTEEPSPAKVNVDTTPLQRSTPNVHSYAPIVKKAAPSVVNIKTTTLLKTNKRQSLLNDPMFRRFFGEQLPDLEDPESSPSDESTRKNYGLGSGVIMTQDGYIVTNHHVIDDADEILVDIPSQDDKEYTATVVGTDPQSDLAILKIDTTQLPSATLGDSDKIEVGDIVIAIGNPFGLGQTVTQGIISALGRNLKISRESFHDFIQTDASINQGNSGGALLDAEGRLIGINTAIGSPTGGNVGIGFAVPVNIVRSVMEQIINQGRVSRGYLGVALQAINPDLAASFNLPNNKGALISDVFPEGGAKKAGVLRGDVVIALNEKTIASPDELRLKIAQEKPGETIKLKILRGGKTKDINIILVERPELPSLTQMTAPDQPKKPNTGELLAGLSIEALTPALRKSANIPPDVQGVFISEVQPNSRAYADGLRPGSVLVEIGNKEVKTIKEAQDGLKSAPNKTRLLLWEEGFYRYRVIEK
jgi:serine protease Do